MRRGVTSGVSLIFVCALYSSATGSEAQVALANGQIRVTLGKEGGVWRLTSLSRGDGEDGLAVRSDEFEILLFDGSRHTVADYVHCGGPTRGRQAGGETIRIDYRRKASAPPTTPQGITVHYTLGDGPYVRKRVDLAMSEGQKIDRLQVLRFSTDREASRGGLGQPVFVGNWFFGADYPGFYSRHSDGFVEPSFLYRIPYDIDLEGGDREHAPRKGLVTLFHFPGHARRQPDGTWGIRSKTAVIGISRNRGEGAELGLLDYIAETRKPTRSHLHYNNWYSADGKTLTVDRFVHGVYRTIRDRLKPYGAKLDAMVPDHGWENSKTFDRVLEPKADDRCDPLPKVAEALMREGTRLGIWVALDGTNQGLKRGLEVGYRSAYRQGFDRSAARWHQGKDYFDILDARYQADLKRSLKMLLVDAKVDYIKHDFNHNFTTHHLSQRHAREQCLDTTLELLAYERELHPGVFQNYTNGTWFSPWWLQAVDCLWMMSGDSGGGGAWPELSLRAGATTYRDKYFFQSFNNPQRCPRPIIPIANFMTHGILFSKKKPFTDLKDTLRDWSDYVVMYFARGTTVKELYIDPELLDEDHWRVLGMAADWAVRNQRRLMNTVFVGGDPEQGKVYGYVSWVDDRAVLALRNPDRQRQAIEVPFDRSVCYRGPDGRAYRAKAIYPFIEPMPWELASGRAFEVALPGESVHVFELEPGPPQSDRAVQPAPLPVTETVIRDDVFELTVRVPDEAFKRHDLVVQPWAAVTPSLRIDGAETGPTRFNRGKGWGLYAYDLRDRRGRTLTITGRLAAPEDVPGLRPDREALLDVWLIADREIISPGTSGPAGSYPYAVSKGFRRLSQRPIERKSIKVQVAPRPHDGGAR
ncbi:MAG TPA: hypothetical protein VM695_12950 [Phycisphaerae bacterium]|nr:hypothetical protein [Phycisphaerae bacterium]